MPFNVEAVVRMNVNEEFSDAWSAVARKGTCGRYVLGFVASVFDGTLDRSILFRYGMCNLLRKSGGCHHELAAFFLVLSRLRNLPPGACMLAVDCRRYCELDGDEGTSGVEELCERYEALAPTLAVPSQLAHEVSGPSAVRSGRIL
jgi:hypothetical protein